MDGKNNKKNQNNYLEDLRRAREFYNKALSFLDEDLEIAANRIYLSYENLSHGFLKYRHYKSSKKHSKNWEGMKKLYLQGLLTFDPKPYLITSYKFHLYVDYGRRIFQKEKIDFNKVKVKELLEILRKLLIEIEDKINHKISY